MNEKLTELSCGAFTAALAGKTPVPGGGGAAALAGALAVSLGAMAGNFTVGKKQYERYETDIAAILKQSEALRLRFLDLVEEDARAFEPLSRAYAIPRDDPGRAAAVEGASQLACRAPMEIAESCREAAALLEELAGKCSAALLSDVGCGAALCRAALEAAALNVFVNTAALPPALSSPMEGRVDRILEETVPRLEGVLKTVVARVRKV